MNLAEALRTSLREIRVHKVRSTLSFAALAVGAGSILYTFAQTNGMKEATRQAIDLMGPGRMTISAKRNYVSRGLSPGLTADDAEEIRRAMPELRMVYPYASRWGMRLFYGAQAVKDVYLAGVTPEWRKRDWVYRLRGRFLNDWDVREAARVCVVVEPGGWIKKPWWASWWSASPFQLLASHHDLLGRYIRLEDHDFTVVGALREPPIDQDPRWYRWNQPNVFVPISTVHRYLRESRNAQQSAPTAVEEIRVDTGDERSVPDAKRRLEAILKRRHRGEEDYEIEDNRDMIQEELNELKKYARAGAILGAVALFAGGIGIMNVTLAALFSRVKEIGIRRALGASRADILAQFVAEASLLGLAGGFAGLGLGWAGIAYFARSSESHRNLSALAWYHLLAVIAVGTAISGLFSLYPAWQAASLDPVDALKDE